MRAAVSGGSLTSPFFTFSRSLAYLEMGTAYTFLASGITPGFSFFLRGSYGAALEGLVGGAISGAGGSFTLTVSYGYSLRSLEYFAPGYSVR